MACLALVGGLVTACVDDEREEVSDDVDPTTQLTVLHDIAGASDDGTDDVTTWAALSSLCGSVYDDRNMQGNQTDLSNNEQVAFVSARVSSIVAGPNCTVTLSDNSGNGRKFAGGAGGTFYYYVGDYWNDRARRATCTCTTTRGLGALIYEDANYTGNYLPLWRNTAGSLAAFWNDRVTAVKTDDGASLVLSQHSPPAGTAYAARGTSSANVGSSFNDLASHFISGGTYWPQCAPTGVCYQSRSDCSGLGNVSPNIWDCFQNRGGASYCQATTDGSICIPSSALGF